MRADANAGAAGAHGPAARRTIVARCAPMLRHFGYDSDPDAGTVRARIKPAARNGIERDSPPRYGQAASIPLWDEICGICLRRPGRSRAARQGTGRGRGLALVRVA